MSLASNCQPILRNKVLYLELYKLLLLSFKYILDARHSSDVYIINLFPGLWLDLSLPKQYLLKSFAFINNFKFNVKTFSFMTCAFSKKFCQTQRHKDFLLHFKCFIVLASCLNLQPTLSSFLWGRR